jgi:hypothetical protein
MQQITQGGQRGHLWRRFIHIAMFFIAPLYFYCLPDSILHPERLVLGVIVALLLLDLLRIWRGWLLFGQRTRERHFLSSFAQGGIAVGLVLLLVPGGYATGVRYAWPLIAVLALVDPLLGELRKFKLPAWLLFMLGWFAASLLWLAALLYFTLPLRLVVLLPLAAVIAEFPNFKYLDDNASMLLVPLLLLYVLRAPIY